MKGKKITLDREYLNDFKKYAKGLMNVIIEKPKTDTEVFRFRIIGMRGQAVISDTGKKTFRINQDAERFVKEFNQSYKPELPM